jgi:DnaJ-class molecular chaperone
MPACQTWQVLSDEETRRAYDSGVDVDDSKWQQSEWQRKEREKARQNVRFGGGANGNFRRQP